MAKELERWWERTWADRGAGEVKVKVWLWITKRK